MPKKIDYTGYENEYLKILKQATPEKEKELNYGNKNKQHYWEYICKNCGNTSYVCSQNVKKIKSCGCSRRFKDAEKELGNKYGRLTILEIDKERTDYEYSLGKQLGVFYKCQCECGTIKTYRLNSIKYGHIKSCGCYASEKLIQRNKDASIKRNRPEKHKDNILGYNDSKNIKVYDEEGKHCFIINKEDYENISKWYWRKLTPKEEPNKRKRYWVSNAKKEDMDNGMQSTIRLHQIIAEIKYGEYNKKEFIPDHLNRNPDDNTKENLMLKTKIENSHNRGTSVKNTSGKTGVYKKGNKWYACITVNYENIFLGSFDDFNDAVKARIDAEKKYGFTCDNIYPEQDCA